MYAYGAAAVDFARGLVLDNQDGSDHSLYANNDGSIIRSTAVVRVMYILLAVSELKMPVGQYTAE